MSYQSFLRILALVFALGVAVVTDAAEGNQGQHREREGATPVDETYAMELVIVRSTRDYSEALSTARRAARKLNVPLDLRDLEATPEGGMSFSHSICDAWTGEYPCYLQRGRESDGMWVSVEPSSGYKELQSGSYIVAVANYPKGSTEVGQALTRSKRSFKDAFVQTAHRCILAVFTKSETPHNNALNLSVLRVTPLANGSKRRAARPAG